ncbi:MAG TPA: GNAT family N-acetyltransferase [Pseudonocardiaceae bacterium]|nr:GNAT family N-acetyltransferase [Pseudonocardiaceae bacterium]
MAEIRDAGPGDAFGIAAVHVASWQAAYHGLLPERVLAALSVADRERTWSAILTDPPPRTAVLLSTREEAIVGFAAVGPAGGPVTSSMAGELYAIYLRPDQWERGIGRQLHQAALDRLSALGFQHATLWVLEGNERAINFYQRNGWAADGTRRIDQELGGADLPERRLRRTLAPRQAPGEATS